VPAEEEGIGFVKGTHDCALANAVKANTTASAIVILVCKFIFFSSTGPFRRDEVHL
jgi:hypothetical protein